MVNGAGAAGIACLELLTAMGMPRQNVILCDTKGVIYQGRKEGMNQWKSGYAAKTKARTLAEALQGADVFFGLSAAGAGKQAMVKSMADKPIIFAMANPDPEITPEEVMEVRPEAIVSTGRSDYPNQINNVLGFPFIFRGALDVQASTINEAMKIAAAKALAALAQEDVPDQVAAAFLGRQVKSGTDMSARRLRSEARYPRSACRGQGCHGYGRGPSSRSWIWKPTSAALRPASIRLPAGSTAFLPRCGPPPSASFLPKASNRRLPAPPMPSTMPDSGVRS